MNRPQPLFQKTKPKTGAQPGTGAYLAAKTGQHGGGAPYREVGAPYREVGMRGGHGQGSHTNHSSSSSGLPLLGSGGLVPTGVKPQKCRFWPQCVKDNCTFVHPSKLCTNFPNCRYGEMCLFIHPLCKYGLNCRVNQCVFTHANANPGGQSNHMNHNHRQDTHRRPPCKYKQNCTRKVCNDWHPGKPRPFNHFNGGGGGERKREEKEKAETTKTEPGSGDTVASANSHSHHEKENVKEKGKDKYETEEEEEEDEEYDDAASHASDSDQA